MRYKGVTRVITVYVSKAGNNCAIDICPEHAEVRVGDRVVWQVQNAPSGVAVTVGNFRRLDPPPDITLRKGKAPLLPEKRIRPNGPSRMAHKAHGGDAGYHKYEILFDGHTVLDPDLEIKGPNR